MREFVLYSRKDSMKRGQVRGVAAQSNKKRVYKIPQGFCQECGTQVPFVALSPKYVKKIDDDVLVCDVCRNCVLHPTL